MNNNVTSLNAAISSVAIPRVEKGHFAAGGPGRPRGSRNRVSSAALASIKELWPIAADRIREAVIDKDNPSHWKACELVARYSLPPSRTIELFGSDPADIREAFQSGEMTADEMKTSAAGLEKLKSIEIMNEFEARLARLESAQR